MKTAVRNRSSKKTDDSTLARHAASRLSELVGKGSQIDLRFRSEANRKSGSATIPMSAFRQFVEILSQMAKGKSVATVPMRRELTTQQAADFLEMSRPSVVKLLDQGEIHFRLVGKHRRILFDDLLAHRKKSMIERHAALDKLANQARKLGMGY